MSFSRRSIKRKEAFREELSSTLRQRSMVSSTTCIEETTVTVIRTGSRKSPTRPIIEEVGDLYSVEKDFVADDENSLTLKRGSLVEVINFGSSSEKRAKLGFDGEVTNILDNSAAKHKLSVRPRRKYTDPRQRGVSPFSQEIKWLVRTVEGTPQQGWVPSNILKLTSDSPSSSHTATDYESRREGVVKELVETEEEFVRDLQHVVDNYIKYVERPSVPRIVKDNVDIIFSNFRQIANFHNTVLIEGVKYYASEPRLLGKTFLRLERDFDKHVAYCRDEVAAQEFLAENAEARDFFEELSQSLGEDKNLSEHLKLPIQRINDYQLLLKELVKYSGLLGENTKDLEKALELMLAIPHRANDNKFLSNIEGFHGNIHKLGRLIRHDWFTLTRKDSKSKERYLFLFKEHILVCKVKRISEDRSVFVLKDIIQLPEVKLIDNPELESFEVREENPERYSTTVCGHKEGVKESWLKEIRKYAPYVFDVEKKADEDNEELNFYDVKEDFECDPISSTASIENQPPKTSENKGVESDNEINKTVIDKEETNKDVYFEAQESVEAEKEKESSKEVVANTEEDKMSRRTSTRIVEESYSVSSQREEVYMQSSRNQYSSSSYSSATAVSAGKSYRSSSITDSSTNRLAIQAAGKPNFVRTITGLSLEPGETAVFECQLDTDAQVTWLKDNKVLEDRLADRVVKSSTDDFSHRLELQSLIEYDSGIYTALAQNKEGSSTCTAQLQVQKISEEEKKRRAEANAPIFTVRLKDTELLRNTNFRFMVKVKGDPMPTVKFLKDGVRIGRVGGRVVMVDEKADIGFYELVISDVQNEDSGQYSCVATNKFGEAHCEGTVTVTDDKKVFEGLEASNLLEPGEKPTFSWLKDGKPFDPEERFKVLLGNEEDSLALVFQHVKPEDAGLYTCVASTTTGRISCSAELSVQGTISQLAREPEKPRFTTEIKETEVNVGGTAMLETKIAGFPKPQVKWFHDGTEIKPTGRFKFLFEDEDVMTLVIKNVTPEDAGSYKIVASNELGEDSTELKLSVKAGPKFKKTMEDVTAKAEETIRITAEIEGTPAPTVKWYKDGNEISSSSRIKTETTAEGSYTLIIEKVEMSDAGSYSVIASNEVNQCSQFFKMDVRVPPKIMQSLEKSLEVSEGETMVLKVKATADPPPKVRWLKDGKEIKADGKKYKISQDGDMYILEIADASREDSARYSVEVSNDQGTTSSKCQAKVKCSPLFKESLKDIKAQEGDTDVEFSVRVNAFPKPNIKWYLGETEITEKRSEYTRKEDGENYKLIIKQVTTELKGKYTCKVVNDVGSAECSADLTVNCKPKFGKTLKPKVQVDEGAELTLQIECTGTPEPDIKWFKDGQEIHADAHIKITRDTHRSESYSMTLNLVKASDAGEYEVTATNILGSASSKTKVEVTKAPEIVSHNFEDRKVTENTATSYKVQVAGVPKPTIKWFRDGKEITASDNVKISEDGDTYKLELLDLQTANSGTYSFKITNELGEKSLEAKLEVESDASKKKPKIKTPLSDKKVSKKEETTFKCVLTAESEPEITWYLNDKPIDKSDKSMVAKVDTKKIDKDFVECTCTVKIPETAQSHAGKYKIKAENKYGYDECSAELTLVLKPEIENLKDITGIPQGEAEFEAKVLYSTDVTWLDKTGKTIKSSDRVTVTEEKSNETYKLKITELVNEDAGEYTLVAKNDVGETKQKVHLIVQAEAPTIVKPLEDMKANDYSDVDFHVRFNGFPKPQVKWLKDGVELTSSDRIVIKTLDEGQVSSMLTIKHFNADDVGEYTVIGSNVAGKAESKCKLKMSQIPPVIGKGFPRSEEVSEGEPLELKCKIDGSPVPKVKWLKNGEPLKADDRIQLVAQPDGTVKLYIENAKPSDSGAYELVAENPNGKATGICAVSVKPKPCKPTIEKGLENVKGVEGEPVKLTAKVVGFPPPDVKWFKDGHPLRPTQGIAVIDEPDGTVGLAFESLKPEDVGRYTMKVSNKAGEAEEEAKLEVQPKEKKPMFEAHLMPASTIEGFPAKLQVKAIGHPKPLIKWTHNGVEVVPDGQRIKVVEMPDGMTCLLLDKATLDDGGEYAAVASNDKGEVASKAELKVTGRDLDDVPHEKPSFLCPLKDVSVNEGTPLSLSATFVGNPLPDAIWTKDDVPLKPDDRTYATCDGRKVTLEINPSAVGDSGVYGCRLVNPLGEDVCTANANVKKVFEPPSFTKKLTDLQQLPNCDAKFIAHVSGMPKPNVEWFFNDKPIKEGDKYHMKTDGDAVCLYVRNCSPEDIGRYRCRAYNKDGEASSEANLDVVSQIDKQPKAEAPAFLKKIGDCEVYKGMTAKFTACATGYPEPEFEWFRDSIKLYENRRVKIDDEGNGLLRLTISNIDVGDVGKYRLRIFNPHGEAFCEAELRFESLEPRAKKGMADQYDHYKKIQDTGVPVPLADKPIISRMTDYHLTLSWKPSIPHGPREPVTYRVEMAEQPDGDWFTVRTGVRSCACEVRNLVPFRDYKFRIRVENKYGISDPSPFAVTYRERLEPDLPKFVPHLGPGVDFRPDSSPYFPKDFDLERPPHDGYKQAPKFLRQEHDVQYGIKNENSNLFWFVYGYPKPVMTYYFNDEPIEMGGRYDCSYTRNGQATLFINKMLERDVGVYEAVAVNEHGEARQRVRMELAEYPRFIQRPEQTIIMLRDSGKLVARVVGVPYPEIKWYKDWQPLAASSRISFQHIQPDTAILHLNDVILKDEGLYSISARNVAGSVSTSVMVRIEENAQDYSYLTYGRGKNVKPRNKPIADLYDLGDELGRGTQGVTYHAVERQTGDNYAAKVMHGRADLKAFMLNELDIMNYLNHKKLIRLHDSFEASDLLIIVMELAGGGELLDNLTRQTHITESEIAGYIRQILWGLEYMHTQGIAHLSLTLGDLLISHPGGDDLKICDFGLSRKMLYGKPTALYYGMPEYVSPEIVNGDAVGYPADMWAVGIITYILLSGYSPFKGLNDRETLTLIKEGKWEFKEEWFSNISSDARDFITKLLVYEPLKRMTVKTALDHPWLNYADRPADDQFKIKTDNLKSYYSSWKEWYKNANCRNWYRRRPLSGAFTHPSKMVYPPGERYTPEPEPIPKKEPREPRTWEENVPSREPLGYEIGTIKSESHYQNGPDTYLLQLRDVDLPCRLRHYLKVAANREAGPFDAVDKHIDWRLPVIRERRRFTDIMDEEIDDERRERINQYGSADVYSIRRLKREIGLRSDGHAEAEAMLEYQRDGHLPIFREKPQLLAIIEDQPAELSCFAVGEPKPTIQWFKNDIVIAESNRIKMTEDEDGRSYLKFEPALQLDVGIYKVVARNRVGQTIARTRVVVAGVPSSPDSPEATEISDTEILLKWKQPSDDGLSPVLCYSLQYKEAANVEWLNIASNIDHEFWLVKDLKPDTGYVFRLSAKNIIGWSEKGIPTKTVRTKESGAPKITISNAMRHMQSHTESGAEVTPEEAGEKLNYSIEKKPIEWSADSNLNEKYSFASEITRGQFSVIAKGIEKSTDRPIVAKVLEVNNDTEEAVTREFENFRSLRHERIVTLLAALRPAPNVAVFVMEKLQGADILTYFSCRHEYNEQMVASVIIQILDGLQYLHWRGLCHLDIQPDNVVLSKSARSLQVKLVDFGSAQKVSKLGSIVNVTPTDYSAPEVVCNEAAFPQTDIWSVGVLTYVLLSGVSPFRGVDQEETRQNITFVRYRFEYLYKELTQEATRFLMLIFKRTPSKRPTVEECYEHRWLLPSEFMIKKRERATFLGNRLKEYCDAYHKEKAEKASSAEGLRKAFGDKILTRSNSIVDELSTA